MKLTVWLVKRRRTASLVALVLGFSGLGLILLPAHDPNLRWVGIPVLILGAALFGWAVWPTATRTSLHVSNLATRLLNKVTWNGRLYPFFPAIGLGVIALDVAYNIAFSASPGFLTEDIVVILAATTLVAYGVVPARYSRERDFVLVFFLILNAVLVLPLLATRAYYRDATVSVDIYSWTALAPETGAILNAIGVNNSVHSVAGSTAPGLTFVPLHFQAQVTVIITTSCSGLYSFGIFASAFTAFTLTECTTITRRFWGLLGLGFLTSYVANLFRMVFVVLVGYYSDTPQTDLQNMLIAHSYAGWVIFLVWISIFWGPILKFMPGKLDTETAVEPNLIIRRLESKCGICSMVLSPTIPATRCVCGRYYHRTCLVGTGRCPACGELAAGEKSGSLRAVEY